MALLLIYGLWQAVADRQAILAVRHGKESLRRGDYALAKRSYNTALSLVPNSAVARLGLACAFYLSSEPSAATLELTKGLEAGAFAVLMEEPTQTTAEEPDRMLLGACLAQRLRRMLGMDSPRGADRLALSAESTETRRLAGALAGAGGTEAKPVVGHLFLALASRPGDHLKVLPNATVLACDIRKRLGRATLRHRLILACDRPRLMARRVHMRIDRELASRGRWSRWGIAWLLYGVAGAVFAIATFFLVILATGLLYLFLWPAALLMAGTRALCGAIVGCDARSYRWLKIPGAMSLSLPEHGRLHHGLCPWRCSHRGCSRP